MYTFESNGMSVEFAKSAGLRISHTESPLAVAFEASGAGTKLILAFEASNQ